MTKTCDYVRAQYQALWTKFELTFFEIWVFIMIWYFLQQQVEIAVVESGIGGISDVTSCFTRQKAVILTSVDYDHQELLGPTIKDIISNKIQICQQTTTPLFVAYDNQKYSDLLTSFNYHFLFSHKLFNHFESQTHAINMSLVVTVLNYFGWPVDEALLSLRLLGRQTLLRSQPYLMLDGAHNLAALRHLIKQTRHLPLVRYVFGFAAHKDYRAMPLLFTTKQR